MNEVGLFLTHQRSARLTQHFQRLCKQSAPWLSWHILYNPADGAEPTAPWLYQPGSQVLPSRYQDFLDNGGLMGGYLDVVLLPIVAASPTEHVWVMEYDVDYSGDWSRFFAQFHDHPADLLTTTLTHLDQSPDWFFWPTAAPPADVDRVHWHRAFHPLMRLSRRFCCWYLQEMTKRPWRGHYEFLLPTAASWGGFTVADLRHPGNQQQVEPNYWNTPTDDHLVPGTFVFRPARERYFHEDPGAFEHPNTLYHPVKPGVALWNQKASESATLAGRWRARASRAWKLLQRS